MDGPEQVQLLLLPPEAEGSPGRAYIVEVLVAIRLRHQLEDLNLRYTPSPILTNVTRNIRLHSKNSLSHHAVKFGVSPFGSSRSLAGHTSLDLEGSTFSLRVPPNAMIARVARA